VTILPSTLENFADRSPGATAMRLLIRLARRTGNAHSREAAVDALENAARAAAEKPLATT
jgi:uncharacterized protein YyaL (SSP411 family)